MRKTSITTEEQFGSLQTRRREKTGWNHMTAWKRSDALNGAYEPGQTIDYLAYKRVRNWEYLGDEKKPDCM